ncbi:Protein YceI [bacterium HR20]|nr:Protein YceI [bacterium HR20]
MMRKLSLFLLVGFVTAWAGEKTFVLTNVGKYRNQAKFTSSAPLETIVGTADGFSGEFTLDIGEFKRASGTITLQVRSMKTGNSTRDGHMYGSDWLDAERYPTISYALRRLENPVITRESERTVVKATAIGDFTMHGTTKELPAQVTITYLPRSEKTQSIADGDFVLVQASFNVPLAQFGVKGKGTIIGSRVGETITVEATLFGVAK